MLVASTNDHYSDRIARPTTPGNPATRWEFDSVGLARTLAAERRRLAMSTRELSHRAGVSQAYIVALERARTSAGRRGPNPTVDVIARLAHALGADPQRLFAAAVRPIGRHALLVVDDHQRPAIEHVQRLTGGSIDCWISATPADVPQPVDAAGIHSISLRRDPRRLYEPEMIAASLARELQRHAAGLEGQSIGLVFAEMSAIMSTIDDPLEVVAFEHQWADVVTDAACTVGAHAAWNVCVYELDALTALDDPVSAAVDLMRNHDSVWAARGRRVATGAAGARRVLEHLRPDATSQRAWRTTTAQLVADLAERRVELASGSTTSSVVSRSPRAGEQFAAR